MHVNRHRFTLCILFIAALLLLGLPAFAQEVTPEVTPTAPAPLVIVEQPAGYGGFSASELILIVALIVVLVAGAFFINSVLKHNKELALKLADALPPWAWDALQAGTERGFAELEDYIKSTPNTVDDDLFARLKQEKDEFFAEMRAEIPRQVAASIAKAMADKSPPNATEQALPPRSGDWQG